MSRLIQFRCWVESQAAHEAGSAPDSLRGLHRFIDVRRAWARY